MINLEIPEDGAFVSNSGLTIVAVYLPQFFNNLRLTRGKKFISEEAAIRATMLTQYIIFGKEAFQDYNLILNKVICDLEIEHPLPESIEITTEEKEVVESMLSAVIKNWNALGNTSIEGLRENFLIRSGKLTLSENSWTLFVEVRAYDALMNMLPWSISTLKLPWMKKPLIVNWM